VEKVDQLSVLEEILEDNAKIIEEKKLQFSKLQEEIRKVNNELPERIVFMENLAENSKGIKLDQETVFDYMTEQNKLYEKWVSKDCKKRALEECVLQLKKAYQEKSITIQELLNQSRSLYFKQFKCIYTMTRLQSHLVIQTKLPH